MNRRMFVDEQPCSSFRQKTVVDMDSGFYEKYTEDKEFGFIISHHTDNVVAMGWASPGVFIRSRYQARHSQPENDVRRVAPSVREVNYHAEMRREQQRMLEWGAWMMEDKVRFRRQLNELYCFMERYGLSSEAAQQKIAAIRSGEDRTTQCCLTFRIFTNTR